MPKSGTFQLVNWGTFRSVLTDTPAYYREKLRKGLEGKEKVIRLAREIGVKLAVGNDTNHCHMDLELQGLVRGGFTPIEAINIATLKGAELCSLSDKTGSLEPGKWADLIAIKGDPTEDILAVGKVYFVIKGGQVVLDQR